MWELDHKEGWVPKNWCFQTVVLEKTLKSPLDSRETKPVNPKGNQPWLFTGWIDAEAPILWTSDVKCWLIGKDSDSGKDWVQEEKGKTEHEVVGWHCWINGYEFEQSPGDGKGQGSLSCYSQWVTKSQTYWATEQQQSSMLLSNFTGVKYYQSKIFSLQRIIYSLIWTMFSSDSMLKLPADSLYTELIHSYTVF